MLIKDFTQLTLKDIFRHCWCFSPTMQKLDSLYVGDNTNIG